MWGDNYAGQLGQKDDVHRDSPILLKSLYDKKIKDISCGFQHVLALDEHGTVYGIGKNDRFQLGEEKKLRDESGEITNIFGEAAPIYGFTLTQEEKQASIKDDESIVQIAAGKFHSLFLSELGNLYSLGANMYGQVGLSNFVYDFARKPDLINTDGMKVKQIAAGHHHNLVLDEEGRIYAFGSNLVGQINGDRSTSPAEGNLCKVSLKSC